MRKQGFVREDVQRAFEQCDGGTIARILACAWDPGLHAVAVYRLGSWLLEKSLLVNALFLPAYFYLSFCIQSFWGIRIGRHAIIGGGLRIGHRGKIFISGLAIIGRNCDLQPNVRIVAEHSSNRLEFPIIGDNVLIGHGVTVRGRVYVGNNARIAPNTLVKCNIPDKATPLSVRGSMPKGSSVFLNIASRRTAENRNAAHPDSVIDSRDLLPSPPFL